MNNIKYDAFISYKVDADIDFARQLQKKIENYGRRWYKGRNTHIYRDETNLSANPDLWQSLKDAIDSSSYCIYLASIEGSNSKWIQRELDYWVSKKGIATIIIVLLDGDIVWNDLTDSLHYQKTNVMPVSIAKLYNFEPKYIDFTNAWNSKDKIFRSEIVDDGIASILSTIKNIPKDEVIGSELKRRRLLLNTFIGISITLIVITTFAIFFAYKSNLATDDLLVKKKELLQSQSMLLPDLAEKRGVHEAAAFSAITALKNIDDVPKDIVDYYLFSQQRLYNLQEIIIQLPINTPVTWRQSTYIKNHKKEFIQISKSPIKDYFVLKNGICFIDQYGKFVYFDIHNNETIYIDMGDDYNYHNVDIYELHNNNILIHTTNQHNSAGMQNSTLILIDHKKKKAGNIPISKEWSVNRNCTKIFTRLFMNDEYQFRAYDIKYNNEGKIRFVNILPNTYDSSIYLSEQCNNMLVSKNKVAEMNFPRLRKESSLWKFQNNDIKEEPRQNLYFYKDSFLEKEPNYSRLSRLENVLEEAKFPTTVRHPEIHSLAITKKSVIDKIMDSRTQVLAYRDDGYSLLLQTLESMKIGSWTMYIFDKQNTLVKSASYIYHLNYGQLSISGDNRYAIIEDLKYTRHKAFSLWDIEKLVEITVDKIPASIMHSNNLDENIAFSKNSEGFALIDSSGVVWIYGRENDTQFSFSHKELRSMHSAVENIEFVDNERLLIGYKSGLLALYDTVVENTIWTISIDKDSYPEEIQENTEPGLFKFSISADSRLLLVVKYKHAMIVSLNNGAVYSGLFDIFGYLEKNKLLEEESTVKLKSLKIYNSGMAVIQVEASNDINSQFNYEIVRSEPATWEAILFDKDIPNHTGYLHERSRMRIMGGSSVRD